jgi:hypothetical protein
MRHWLGLALFTLLLAAPLGVTSPVQPQEPQLKTPLAGYSSLLSIVPCKGGERSVAIAATPPNSSRSVLLGLYVFDPHGNCIARDEYDDRVPPREGRRPATDDVAVEWFPPSTATYTVELRNLSPDPCVLHMAIR